MIPGLVDLEHFLDDLAVRWKSCFLLLCLPLPFICLYPSFSLNLISALLFPLYLLVFYIILPPGCLPYYRILLIDAIIVIETI